jgi:hypothetical protein
MTTRKYKNVKKRALKSKKIYGKYGGTTRSSSKSNSKSNSKSSTRKSPSYEDQKNKIEDIKKNLAKKIKKMNITKNSSFQELEIADDIIRSLNDVNKLKEINNLLKELNNKGGKRVRKTRKYKR